MGNLSEWLSYYLLRLVQRVMLLISIILTTLTFVFVTLALNNNVLTAKQISGYGPHDEAIVHSLLRAISVAGIVVASFVVILSLVAFIEPRTRRYDKARTFDAVVIGLACIGLIFGSQMIVHGFLQHFVATGY